MNEKTLKKAQELKTNINNLKRRIADIRKKGKGSVYEYLKIRRELRSGTLEFWISNDVAPIKKIMDAIKNVLEKELVKKQKQLEKM